MAKASPDWPFVLLSLSFPVFSCEGEPCPDRLTLGELVDAPNTSWKGAGGSPESCRARPGNALTPRLEIRATDSADIPHERWLYFDL